MHKTIHLVDDDRNVRTALARLLMSGGYTVHEYASGTELIEAVDGLTEGCILLDINMPELDGFAVTKVLADHAVQLPVVMMTGAGDLTLLAWKAGVSAYLPKPFGKQELLAVLDQIASDQFVATV